MKNYELARTVAMHVFAETIAREQAKLDFAGTRNCLNCEQVDILAGFALATGQTFADKYQASCAAKAEDADTPRRREHIVP